MTRGMPARSFVTPTFVQSRDSKQRLYSGEAVVAEFEDQDAAGLEMLGGLGDEVGVEFVAFFAAEERGRGFVVADFARERCASLRPM